MGATGSARTGQLAWLMLEKADGQHELKFGFDGRVHQINYIQTNAPVAQSHLRRERYFCLPEQHRGLRRRRDGQLSDGNDDVAQ